MLRSAIQDALTENSKRPEFDRENFATWMSYAQILDDIMVRQRQTFPLEPSDYQVVSKGKNEFRHIRLAARIYRDVEKMEQEGMTVISYPLRDRGVKRGTSFVRLA